MVLSNSRIFRWFSLICFLASLVMIFNLWRTPRVDFSFIEPKKTCEDNSVPITQVYNVSIALGIHGSKDERVKACLDTWLKDAEEAGISIIHFGHSNYAIPELKFQKDDAAAIRTRKLFSYMHNNYSNFDWFVKFDDDAYVYVKNLVSFLRQYNPKDPYFFGFLLVAAGTRIASGGAGYVLSWAALNKVADEIKPDKQPMNAFEDVDTAWTLNKYGIHLTDAPGFHPYTPEGMIDWQYEHPPWGSTFLRNEPRDWSAYPPISYHYVDKDRMYLMDGRPGKTITKTLRVIFAATNNQHAKDCKKYLPAFRFEEHWDNSEYYTVHRPLIKKFNLPTEVQRSLISYDMLYRYGGIHIYGEALCNRDWNLIFSSLGDMECFAFWQSDKRDAIDDKLFGCVVYSRTMIVLLQEAFYSNYYTPPSKAVGSIFFTQVVQKYKLPVKVFDANFALVEH